MMQKYLTLMAAAFAVLLCRGVANAGTVVGGSDLLTGAALSQVESWLVNDPQLGYSGSLAFTNIFDKAAGNTSANFHAAVDGKGPTVVLMEVHVGTQSIQIIGGFNPRSWYSLFPYYNSTPNVADRTAFIFNLSALDRRDQETADIAGQAQTYNNPSYGPVFGPGDILVEGDLVNGSLWSFVYCVNSANTCNYGDGYMNLLGMPSPTNISIGQLEVFTISEDVSQTPLPAALPLFTTGLGTFGFVACRRKRAQRSLVQGG